MLIYNILKNQKKNLKFLGNTDENVEVITRTFKDFKKHRVSLKMLEETMKNIEDKYLLTKLKDVQLIYNLYEESLKDKYTDEDDILTILADKIEKSDMFKDSIIYIDEFAGFTKQEYELITSLIKIADTVNITICSDTINNPDNPNTDIFYYNKITAQKLIECAKKANVKVLSHINLKNVYRFKSEELYHLEQNIYNVKFNKYKGQNNDITLFLANNPYTEIEYVARNIINLVKDKHIRYKDISIITKNINTYSSLIKAIFLKYGIPVFIDTERDLSQNVLIKYILSILDIFSNNWSHESMFNYIKTGFLDLDKNSIFELENYCIKYGIKGKKWYNESWEYGEDEELTNRVNGYKKQIVEPLVTLKNNIIKNKTVKQFSKELYLFLVNSNMYENMNKKIEYLQSINEHDIANEYKTSINLVTNLLDELVLLLGDEIFNFESYKDILKIGFLNSSLKNIPATLDEVIVGDVDRTRSHRVKAMFIIGLNDGVFPSVNTDEGFINDEDREILKENNLEIAKSTKEQLYEEQFNIYKAFSTAEEKLFLSYPSTDREAKALRNSIITSKIKNINPNLKPTSEITLNHNQILTKSSTFNDLLSNISNYCNGKEIDDIWFNIYNLYKSSKMWESKLNKAIEGLNYTNKPEKIKQEYIDKLYGNTLKTSVSKLEQYRKCPFSFYLKYGLNVSEKETNKIQAIDTGAFMHEVIDEFFETIQTRELSIKSLTRDDIRQIVNRIVEDKLQLRKNYIFTSTPKFIVLTAKLKKVILKSIEYIIYQLSISSFEVFGNEVSFTNGGQYPPIIVKSDDGKEIEITGKIDRIDIAKGADGRYIRIIDYKSSAKNIELNQVVAGLQIQLLTYMEAITKFEDVIPAGILYFNLIDTLIKNNRNLTDEQIEEEIRKQFKMKGLILADINIIKMMDNKLEKGYSDVLPVYIDKDGEISSNKSSIATKEEFEKMQKYINRLIKQISKEILSGNIDIKPCYNAKTKSTPCTYCKYKSICKFNTTQNEYEYISNLSKQECIEKMEENI